MSQRTIRVLFMLYFGVALMIAGFPANTAEAPLNLAENQYQAWARFYEEHQGHKLMVAFSENTPAQPLAITGITVIPMTEPGLLPGQTVVVEGGKFAAIGPAGTVSIPENANTVNGAGRYLIPGLVEGHAHTLSTLSQFLVYLTRGVTTVREMDGFPWMLEARALAARNELLIPSLFVAGHILSHRAWDFYMTQVDTPDQARALVAEQAAGGYDFIKIHNSLPEPLFSAVFEAAQAHGLDVVGHIPNEIAIAGAIAAGMRTNEHFKGYIFDEDLTITTQDYVAATAGSDLWNAPSFSNYHEHLRGEEAVALAKKEDSLRLVPRWLRSAWLEQAAQPLDKLTELRQTIYPKSRTIFTGLLPVTDKFLAGTDTGTYAFQVPGYALQEEVRIFESLGLTPYQALKTATVNAAAAMRKETEFGAIDVGKRGDFVVLNSNPLENTANLADIWGVSVRGVWLSRDALNRIEDSLEAAFGDQTPIPAPSRESFVSLVEEMETLRAKGFPYPDYLLEEVENLFRDLGQEDLACRINAMQRVHDRPIQTPE